jgi:hypothetical protein
MTFGIDFAAIAAIPFADMVKQEQGVKAEQGDKPDGKADGTAGRRAFLSRIHRRRFACLQAAAEAAAIIPAEGEAVHVVMSGCYDLQHVLIVLLERLGSVCETMRVATLSLSRRNVQEMAALLDGGTVRRIDLLTSDFFRRHDDDIFAELAQEFHARGQRVAAARSHCKVVTMKLEDGRCYVLHGSPNLRTNKNLEQFALERDAALHAHYDAWLDSMVTRHAINQSDSPPTG